MRSLRALSGGGSMQVTWGVSVDALDHAAPPLAPTPNAAGWKTVGAVVSAHLMLSAAQLQTE